MANEQNLVPLTTSKAREIGKKGGKASGEAKRQRKELRELMLAALDADVKLDGENVNAKVAMVKTLLYSALKDQDLAKIKYIAELIGESPAQKIELTGKDGKDLNQPSINAQEAREFVKEMGKEFGWDMTHE